MEDYKKFRITIDQFTSSFENEIELILNSINNIQYSNRKFYDRYAKLQNDFQDVNSKFYYPNLEMHI